MVGQGAADKGRKGKGVGCSGGFGNIYYVISAMSYSYKENTDTIQSPSDDSELPGGLQVSPFRQ